MVTDAGSSLYDLENIKPAQTELIKAQTKSAISQRNLTDAQKLNVEQTLSNLKSQNDIMNLEKQLKQWEVNNQDISNIINWAQKLLGLIPGIGGLLKR